MNKAWHCYVQPGQTYQELIAQHGHEKMRFAVLHMPEISLGTISKETTNAVNKPWWAFWRKP